MSVNKNGAGFVVFREDTLNKKEPLILALIQSDGVYDIPKGRIDEGETALATALRECFEESSIVINDEDFLFHAASPFVETFLTIYCAKTNSMPMITKNPHSGILEHEGFEWVSRDQFCNNCLPFLNDCVNHFYSEWLKSYNS